MNVVDADAPTEPIPARGGPRTPEGRARSRLNALKHGLRARVVLPEAMAEALDRRAGELDEQFRPESAWAIWLVRQVALAMLRLEDVAARLAAHQAELADRASTRWDSDRQLDAEELAARLDRDPARIARALRATRPGSSLMTRRWEGLCRILDLTGGWDETQRRLALNLLGTPAELRGSYPDLPPDATPEALRAVVARELASLERERAESLDTLDADHRELAAMGMPPAEDRETRRLRRYEAEIRRALNQALEELRRLRPQPAAKPARPGRPLRPAQPSDRSEPARPPSNPDARTSPLSHQERTAPTKSGPPPKSDPDPRSRPNRRLRRKLEKEAREAQRQAARSGQSPGR